MPSPKSPCLACPREDRDHCAESCPDLTRYRQVLDAMDPDEALRARRARILELGAGILAGPAAGLDRPSPGALRPRER